jgi:hypothetical protein
MIADSWGNNLESKIAELDQWIAALKLAETGPPRLFSEIQFTAEIKMGIFRHLSQERNNLQDLLNQHQQQRQEVLGY